MRHDVGGLLDTLAVAPDTVARNIGADVEVDPERGNTGVADVGHADNGTGFRIELAEPVKRCRELLRQDREIALDKAVRDPRRARGQPGPVRQARLQARKLFGAFANLLLCRQNGHLATLPIISTTVKPKPTIKSNLTF